MYTSELSESGWARQVYVYKHLVMTDLYIHICLVMTRHAPKSHHMPCIAHCLVMMDLYIYICTYILVMPRHAPNSHRMPSVAHYSVMTGLHICIYIYTFIHDATCT